MKTGTTLYLLVGYPGSGKTTTSQIIHSLTGATHIWSDHERRAMFGTPTHTSAESQQLYAHLNQRAEELLAAGKSVIFDTNFNFRYDRQKLRVIAAAQGATTKLIWVKTTKAIARARALHDSHASGNTYRFPMTRETFDRMSGNLQPPEPDEEPIILDGSLITTEYVSTHLGLPLP